MQTPEFIYFDLGKVLVEFSHDHMCSQMGELVGLDGKATRAVVFESGLSDRYETGEIDDAQFCELFFEIPAYLVLRFSVTVGLLVISLD